MGTSEIDIKKHFKSAGMVKSIQIKRRIATVTFASPKQAEKAISELDKSSLDGQTRYLEVQADNFAKSKKRADKDDGECKWCEKGECWDHGQIEKPEKKEGSKPKKAKTGEAGKVKKGQLKQTGGAKSKGGGKGKVDMMQAMMAMMGGKGKSKGKGKGKGKAGGRGDCKWCKAGQCWSH